jgi:hypothetical protein
MAKVTSSVKSLHTSVHKRTRQGGRRIKTSALNKVQKRTVKKYIGQGR